MAGYVYGAPSAPPTPTNQWKGLGLVWVGPDGSEWDLTDWAADGLQLVREDVEGLEAPPITKNKSKSRAIPGARIRGWRAEERPVFWPIYLWGNGSDEWLARHRAFFATIHPENPGTWKVTSDQTRALQCTGVFDDTDKHQVDPLRRGWALYGISLEAVQPYWQGETISYGTWSIDEPVDFIPSEGGPPYTISAGWTLGAAAASNPGDVELWPTWTVTDQWDAGLTLGIDGVNIVIPFALNPGDVLVIDTDPRNPTATKNGVDATAALGLQSYATIPPAAEVPLTVAGTGTGSVSCAGTPLYFRAF